MQQRSRFEDDSRDGRQAQEIVMEDEVDAEAEVAGGSQCYHCLCQNAKVEFTVERNEEDPRCFGTSKTGTSHVQTISHAAELRDV